MKDTHCICEHLVPMEHKTPVDILMHFRERITTTNTGKIAHFLLKNSRIHYRGLINSPLSESDVMISGYTPLYLYPSESSVTLTPELVQSLGKVQLIVPDGSWRQAKRVARRESFLKDAIHVKLPISTPGIFYLRRKIKQEGVSTLEAIARALAIIESTEIRDRLENVFRIMIEKTLETRGKKLEHYERYLTSNSIETRDI